MGFIRSYWLIVVLLCANSCIYYYVANESRGDILTVSFLNIGQGDAIFIQAPNGNQILVDSGPPHSVLSELRHVMPLYDRSIDMLVITNPDADHIGGFIDAVTHLEVSSMLEPGTRSDSAINKELHRDLVDRSVPITVAQRGMKIMIDPVRNIYFSVLFPDRNVSLLTTNDGSLQMKLIYGETSYMLTGDSPQKIEEYLVSLGDDVQATVLKAGHHGSRTSTGEIFVRAVHPQLVVISCGKNNSYGHPHKETLDTLHKLHVPYIITAEYGRIITTSDGKRVEVN